MPKGEKRLLMARKHNNYPPQSAYSVDMTWHEGVLGEVAERQASITLLDQVEEVIEALGPLTPTEIADELNREVMEDSEKISASPCRACSRVSYGPTSSRASSRVLGKAGG